MSCDTDVLLWLHAHGSPAFDGFFIALTRLGSLKVLTVLFTLQAVFFALRREKAALALTVKVSLAAYFMNWAGKALTARARPQLWDRLVPAGGYSFPSGHALGAAAFFGLLACLLSRAYPGRRGPIWAFCGFMILGIGISRLYLGVHWPTDVLAGWVLGAGLAVAGVTGMRPDSWETRVEGLELKR